MQERFSARRQGEGQVAREGEQEVPHCLEEDLPEEVSGLDVMDGGACAERCCQMPRRLDD
jgi:hypothetical protein